MTWLLVVLLVAAENPRIAFADGRGEVTVTGISSEAECKRVAHTLTGQLGNAGFSVSYRCERGG